MKELENVNDTIKVVRTSNQKELQQEMVAYNNIPFKIISDELGDNAQAFNKELKEIKGFYNIYELGASFLVEGTNGDYVPSNVHYMLATSLINKQARFLFGERPDITIESKGNKESLSDDSLNLVNNLNIFLNAVLDENNFEDILLKAAKDAFIGKRVAALVNFDNDEGISIQFLPATQFIYEFDSYNTNKLVKFVSMTILENSSKKTNKRILKKKYTLSGSSEVYLNESIYDGSGKLVEEIFKTSRVNLNQIPAVVFLNDGLTGDYDGESEIKLLENYEASYSKIANADIDAERKSMNPIRYAVDMNSQSTKDLSSSPGSFWDLQSDQNLNNSNPSVGIIESNMAYSESLKTTLERLKNQAHDQVDVPNINLETMSGVITSGKGLKAIYWPSIIRAAEKMKMWGPKLRQLVEIILDGADGYPKSTKKYTDNELIKVSHVVTVKQVSSLPEDEDEEKKMDLQEVNYNTMSRKTYMKKWHGLTDAEVEEELRQIADEIQIFEDSAFHDRSLLP